MLKLIVLETGKKLSSSVNFSKIMLCIYSHYLDIVIMKTEQNHLSV